MAQQHGDIVISSLKGGLNDTDAPNALAENECVTATNVEFFKSELGERRAGCASLDLTSSGLTGQAGIVHLSQWFSTNVVTTPEYVAIAATPSTSVAVAHRSTAGTWSALTPNDAINNTAPDVFNIVAQPLDANLFIAYRSSVNRMHVWDGTTWRGVGLTQPAAPTVANTGAGSFNGPRFYRVRYIVKSGSTILRRSEPSTATKFTPSGTGAAARVTKPTTISEAETHWELEASEDNSNFYLMATTAVATTTADDTTATSKTFPAPRGAGAPVSTDGTNITYVLLSDQAAALNLKGTISNGSYGGAVIAGRGWIGYTAADVLIPQFTSTWTAGTKWYASPDVATVLEARSSGNGANYAATGILSDAVGSYLLTPSAKFLTVDGDRLVYGGHWTDTTQQAVVGWTPVKADPGVGNSERAPIVTTGGTAIVTTRDLDNLDGGPLTGISASSLGTWYAFKWQRIYSAIRSNDVTNAYDIQTVSTTRGAVPGSIVRAVEANGKSTIYFLDPYTGPSRLGPGGVVTTIRGIRATWRRVNLKAANVTACGLYYPYKQQIWWWVSVDGGDTPTILIKLQISELKSRPDGTLSGGLSLADGKIATARCCAPLTYTSGNVTTDLPFAGLTSPDFVQRCDTGTDDNGTAFTATVRSRPNFWAGLLNKFGVMFSSLLATADANGSIKVSLIRDEGLQTKPTKALSLAPTLSEPQVIIPIDDLVMSEMRCIQVEFTDGQAGKNWEAQRFDMKPRSEERA